MAKNNQQHDQSQDGKRSRCYIEQDTLTDDMQPVTRGGKPARRTTPNSEEEADANIEACINENKGRVNLKALGL